MFPNFNCTNLCSLYYSYYLSPSKIINVKLSLSFSFPPVFAILFLPLLSSCVADCGPSDGESPITKAITVGEFQSVDLTTDCKIIITEAQGQKVEIRGYQKAIDNLEFKVKDGILTINDERNCNNDGKVPEISITIPVVRDLSVSGSGEIKTTNTLAADDHKLEVSGSGRIVADLNSKTLKSEVSGSGTLTLKGNSVSADHEISGSGSIRAFELLTANAKVEVSGSGNAEVSVNGTLKADVAGSGNVKYKGNPEVKQELSGSGSVTKVE